MTAAAGEMKPDRKPLNYETPSNAPQPRQALTIAFIGLVVTVAVVGFVILVIYLRHGWLTE